MSNFAIHNGGAKLYHHVDVRYATAFSLIQIEHHASFRDFLDCTIDHVQLLKTFEQELDLTLLVVG